MEKNKVKTDSRLVAKSRAKFAILNCPPLGLDYHLEHCSFRLYSAEATKVELLLFPKVIAASQAEYLARATNSSQYQSFLEQPTGANFAKLIAKLEPYPMAEPQAPEIHLLKELEAGYFCLDLPGEHFSRPYLYRLSFPQGESKLTIDPYAKLTFLNGRYGVVGSAEDMDLPCPNLIPFEREKSSILELNVRDFSIRPNAKFKFPGTFLALTEEGLTNSSGEKIGLDHIRELGVSLLQLLPIFQSATLDELGDVSFNSQFNWGYDPLNYFAVQGLFSSQPKDPFCRILELKFLSHFLASRGLGLSMDVVYNHVYDLSQHSLELTNPGLCFRYTEDGMPHNGSFCGNETKSENEIFRRYFLDSLLYWQKNFELAAFRFDLMGLHDVDSMNLIADELKSRDPEIKLYGEGWIMGNHPEGVLPANETEASSLPAYAFFNDSFRNLGRALLSEPEGILEADDEEYNARIWHLYNSLIGGQHVKSFVSASQNLCYLECHDNLTLTDLIQIKNAEIEDRELSERLSLALFLVCFAQGLPFFHLGQEFARSKQQIDNSYNASDEINALDWESLTKFKRISEKLAEFLKFRNSRLSYDEFNFQEINHRYKLLIADPKILAYELQNAGPDGAENLLFVINFQASELQVELPTNYEEVLDTAMASSAVNTLRPYAAKVYRQVALKNCLKERFK
ncbi:MAG: hypothetical protein Q4P65_03880 [Eubacteriales bacterium]|nr:hypothetical protein [Eubacteriales bacterium]